jgi:four helix bundle protein
MGTIRTFEEIEAWQKARELVREIYRISNHGPFSRDFGLRDQIRRASVSIMSNIAEGFERDGTGEFIQYLSMVKGSLGEVKSQLYVAFDLGYLDEQMSHRLSESVSVTGRMVAGLIKYLRQSKLKGAKYKRASARKPHPVTRNQKLETGN